MAHHWEIDPITLVPTKPVRPQIIPSRDGARLSAWQAETFLHRTPVFKFGLAAAILGPTMARIDAGLADPNSQMYQNLIQAGSYWENQLPRGLSEISADTIRWLTKTALIAISLDQRTGPVPIATAEAINAFISTVLLFGGGIVSGIRQWFDTYDKRLVKGDVPVSPLYPVKRVVFAHPAIAENYADTHASREPMYGSIYVNPRKSNKNSDEPSCVIPKFPYGYRTRIDELDERVPGKRHAWCRHIGLDRAGTVVALPQKPGRELFGSLEKRMLQPYHVVAMLDEMDGLQEGFWKGKTLELGFPPLFHYESSYKDPIAEVVGLGRSYGANVVDISPERNFVAEMQAIATRRAREIDPENTA